MWVDHLVQRAIEVIVIASHQCTHVEHHPAVTQSTTGAAGLSGETAYDRERTVSANGSLRRQVSTQRLRGLATSCWLARARSRVTRSRRRETRRSRLHNQADRTQP